MPTTVVPHRVVKLGFVGARLPISIAERIGERAGVDVSNFPPVVFYGAVEAQAKKVVGRIIRDEELVEEGSRQESAIRHRSGAEMLSAEAEEKRQSADAKLQDRVEDAERTRDRIRQQTEERKAQIEKEEQEAKRQARDRAKAREDAVRQAARTREKAVEAKERQAELARVQAETRALEKQSEAIEAEKVVTAIDERLDDKKNGRRNGNS